VRTIRRYILREIAVPFALGLAVVTLILLIARILKLVELVVNRGVPFLQVVKLFSYILPAFLEVTVPMAVLLSVLVAFGRLSSDSEVTALKASGISLYQLVPPVAVFATTMLVVCLGLSLYLRPWANDLLRTGLYDIAKTRASAGIRERVFNDEFSGLIIYVDQIEQPGNQLRGILISDSREASQRDTVLAKLGTLVSDESAHRLALRLYDGQVHTHDQRDGSYHRTEFDHYDIILNLEDALAKLELRTREPSEMPSPELRSTIRSKRERAEDANPESVELQRRLSIPFACLAFAAVAIPLGVRPSRSVRSRGLTISLALIFSYYLVLSFGQSLGERGVLPPVVAMWLPNLLLAALAFFLFRRAARDTATDPSQAAERLDAMARAVMDFIDRTLRRGRSQ